MIARFGYFEGLTEQQKRAQEDNASRRFKAALTSQPGILAVYYMESPTATARPSPSGKTNKPWSRAASRPTQLPCCQASEEKTSRVPAGSRFGKSSISSSPRRRYEPSVSTMAGSRGAASHSELTRRSGPAAPPRAAGRHPLGDQIRITVCAGRVISNRRASRSWSSRHQRERRSEPSIALV